LNFFSRHGVDTKKACNPAGKHLFGFSYLIEVNAMDAHPSLLPVNHRFRILLILVLVALLLAGCKSDPNEEFIQGQWYDNDDHLSNLAGESRQETSWYFEDKTFEVYGCCFAPMDFSGYYRVVESEGDTLQLELYRLNGQNGNMLFKDTDVIPVEININREADTIQFGSGDEYIRVGLAP
jgi:hypothetical protein